MYNHQLSQSQILTYKKSHAQEFITSTLDKTIIMHTYINIFFFLYFFQVAFSILVIQSTVAWAIPEHKEKRSLTGTFPFAAHHQHSQGTVFKIGKTNLRKSCQRSIKAKGHVISEAIFISFNSSKKTNKKLLP